jgi:hypothetical protein
MSGGSFDYASQACDLEDLLIKRGQLADLQLVLETYEGADLVAADLGALLNSVTALDRRVTARLQRLREVMHAVEWHVSCDWSEDQVLAAIAKYNLDDQEKRS